MRGIVLLIIVAKSEREKRETFHVAATITIYSSVYRPIGQGSNYQSSARVIALSIMASYWHAIMSLLQ